LLTSLLSAKAAAAAAAAAVTIGGLATAAYAGALPGAAQQVAHDTIGAPSPRASSGPSTHPTPVGPNATGPAAFGLCTAYEHAKAHGTASQKAVAFRNLAAAAGGAANVDAYCATVPHPGTSPSGAHSSHPSGPPSAHRSGPPSLHPSGPPSSHPSGPPSSVPSRIRPTSANH
jgi:hypothetical protein